MALPNVLPVTIAELHSTCHSEECCFTYKELSVMFKSAKLDTSLGGLRRNTFGCLDMVTDLVEGIKLSVPWEPAITHTILRFNLRLLCTAFLQSADFTCIAPRAV